MDRAEATEIANSWYELIRADDPLREEYHRLLGCLTALLPADTNIAAGAIIDGEPGVLALAGDGLFVVTFEQSGEGAHEPVVDRLPLAAEAVVLRIRDRQANAPSGRSPLSAEGGTVAAHVRDWTLTWPGGHQRLSFSSVVRRFGGFDTGPDAAEPFGRALAGQLGWTIPS